MCSSTTSSATPPRDEECLLPAHEDSLYLPSVDETGPREGGIKRSGRCTIVCRTVFAAFVPAALWYSLCLVVSLLPAGDDAAHWQWLLLNLGLSGFLYWAVTQLLLGFPKSWATRLAVLLLAWGAASVTCRLATTLFYPQGGNPCRFFPGAYYDPLAEANRAAASYYYYYTLEETQECQNWATITYVSALLWAGLIAPCMVRWLQQSLPHKKR